MRARVGLQRDHRIEFDGKTRHGEKQRVNHKAIIFAALFFSPFVLPLN